MSEKESQHNSRDPCRELAAQGIAQRVRGVCGDDQHLAALEAGLSFEMSDFNQSTLVSWSTN